MSALMSKSGEWGTPPWLVEKIRVVLGGYISLDAAASDTNKLGTHWFTKERSALDHDWLDEVRGQAMPTLFLNPPGERSGKLIRSFWDKWHVESQGFHAASWIDFNLDHLRFIERVPSDCLIIPRKRLAFVDALTGLERRGAQIGGFILLRGSYQDIGEVFPGSRYLLMHGDGYPRSTFDISEGRR